MKNTESPYDRAAELLKFAMEEMKTQDVPDADVPPVLADFCVWTALRIGGTAAGEAILERMRREVTQWTLGTHPMQEKLRQAGEKVPSTERLLDDPELDLSPLRIAMEHLLVHQRQPLDRAAAVFVGYATSMVHQRLGAARAKDVLSLATYELVRVEMDAESNADDEET